MDACYRSFLGLMERSGSTVLSLDWQDFGSTECVADAIAHAHCGAWTDTQAISQLVYNSKAIRARLRLPEGIRPLGVEESDEAEFFGATDATVEDSYSTPIKPAARTAAEREDLTRTPEPAAKSARVVVHGPKLELPDHNTAPLQQMMVTSL